MSQCKARVWLKRQPAAYPCQVEAPHPGESHQNFDAEIVWCSHGEACATKRKEAAQ